MGLSDVVILYREMATLERHMALYRAFEETADLAEAVRSFETVERRCLEALR